MKEQIISLETFKLADRLGLPVIFEEEAPYKIIKYTQSILQRWIREAHKIDITVALVADAYGFYIHKNRNYTNKGENYGISGKTYEEALEKGLFEALKLIK